LRAVDVLFDVLRSEGVSKIFGNPGSTEMPLMDALYGVKDFQYVLGLQEATVVGMADGYAQATNRASFVNLHTAGGIGHAMGTIAGAKLTRTPMVVTAGNQDTGHLAREPWLSGDLVAMAKPCVKWATEVNRAEDVGYTLRRAFAIANAHPRGPVFVSLPMDLMLQEVKSPAPHRSADPLPAPANISTLTKAIAETPQGKLALLLSDSVIHANGAEAAVAAAERLGCAVFGTPLLGRNVFPIDHPQWHGVLPPDFDLIGKTLSAFDLAIMTGDHEMLAYPYREGGPFPSTLKLAQISPHAGAMGQDGAASFALVGDIAETLATLANLPQREKPASQREKRAAALATVLQSKEQQEPLHPFIATRAILECVTPGTQIINESSGTYDTMREQWCSAKPGDYYFVRSGNLGWGMPAAVGVALARPDRKVISFVGDGAAMYSPQAMWSSRRYGANVCFIVFNNRKYDILMRVAKSLGFDNANAGKFVEMQFDQPAVNFEGLAQTFGAPYAKATDSKDIATALKDLLSRNETTLLEIETSGL
jgi:benzoylformate decarboxylase